MQTLIVRDRTGQDLDPEPVEIDPSVVVDHLLPQSVGIDPASLLERAAEAAE